tara:strand:- start:176 stop:523 length:348 start_codon:yes stop_codon:yes gene_type:complete
MDEKEIPIYSIRAFKCPNCGSRKLEWEYMGFDNNLSEKHPWYGNFQFCCCRDCHKILPSHLSFFQYSYPSYEERKREYEDKFKKCIYEPSIIKLMEHDLFYEINQKELLKLKSMY